MSASITLTGATLAQDGATLTATLSGGSGSGYAPASGVTGLTVNGPTGAVGQRAATISGTTLTIPLAAFFASSVSLTLGIAASSNLTDSAGNTVTGQSNLAVTNNSACVGWYRGDLGRFKDAAKTQPATTNGDAVAVWADQSGAGNDLTQTTAGDRGKVFGGQVCLEYGNPSAPGNAGLLTQHYNVPATFDRRSVSAFLVAELCGVQQLTTAGANSNQQIAFGDSYLALDYFSANQGFGVVNYSSVVNPSWAYKTPTSRSLFGLLSGSGGLALVQNHEVLGAGGAAYAGTAANFTIGQFAGGGVNAPMRISDVLLYNAALSPTPTAAVQSYAQSRGAVFPTAATENHVFIGDSITVGAANTLNQNWPSQIGLPGMALIYNDSEAGNTQASIASGIARNQALYIPGIVNRAYLGGGINDIAGSTAATVLANTQAAGTALKASGFSVYPCTLTPAYGSSEDATWQGKHDSYNSSLRALFAGGGHPSWADGLIDYAADPNIGQGVDAQDTSKFPDGVHPADSTSSVMAGIARPFAVPPTAPVITSPATASATVGQAFSYQITATNNPTSFDATGVSIPGLPAGLSVNQATGLISGTPTDTPATYSIGLVATNATDSGTAILALTLSAITTTVNVVVSAAHAGGFSF